MYYYNDTADAYAFVVKRLVIQWHFLPIACLIVSRKITIPFSPVYHERRANTSVTFKKNWRKNKVIIYLCFIDLHNIMQTTSEFA